MVAGPRRDPDEAEIAATRVYPDGPDDAYLLIYCRSNENEWLLSSAHVVDVESAR